MPRVPQFAGAHRAAQQLEQSVSQPVQAGGPVMASGGNASLAAAPQQQPAQTGGVEAQLQALAQQAQQQAATVTAAPTVQDPLTGAQLSESGMAAVRWARSKVGIHESGGNTVRQLGFAGQAWCGLFVTMAANKNGAKVTGNTAYVPTIMQEAKSKSNGFAGWTSNTHAARPGDFVVLFGGGHVELVTSVNRDGSVNTIGGNTSTPGGGEGVARKTRSRGQITGIAKVRYG